MTVPHTGGVRMAHVTENDAYPLHTPASELDTAEAAALLGVGPSMLRRYPIPYTRNGPRGRRRYLRADVIAYRQDLRDELARRAVDVLPDPAWREPAE